MLNFYVLYEEIYPLYMQKFLESRSPTTSRLLSIALIGESDQTAS